MELYEKIKDLRERNNISQKEFAQILNISPSTYNSYEKGNSTYTAPMLKTICETLHCSSDELLGLNQSVSICKVKIYQLVVVLLSQGKTYDEIIDYINNIDIDEYKKLNEEEQDYIQRIFRKDLNSRKRKLEL